MKKTIKWLLVVITTYLLILFSTYLFQEKLIFHPTKLAQDYRHNFPNAFEEVFLENTDGGIVNALHFKRESPKGILLYFHGNRGNLKRWAKAMQFFVDLNYDVFVMDYRTYGKSTGLLSEQALYSDAEMCYTYLTKHYEESDIILYGRSLGTGLATYVASKNHPRHLILEAPYYSLKEVAIQRFPLFPVSSMLKYEFPLYKFMQKVNCPITIFHGTNDQVIPYESATKLVRSKDQNKPFLVTIEKGTHHKLNESNTYLLQIKKILN